MTIYFMVRGKVNPIQAWTGPKGTRRRSSHIPRHSAHEGGKIVNPTHQPPLPPTLPGRKYSWYSLLLEADSTQGHSEARRFMSIKKF
jgi:hypothetical protein